MRKRLSPETIKKIKELRAKGMSYGQISLKLGIIKESIVYHSNDKYRERTKKHNREYMKKEYHKNNKRKEYMRKYMKNKYWREKNGRET